MFIQYHLDSCCGKLCVCLVLLGPLFTAALSDCRTKMPFTSPSCSKAYLPGPVSPGPPRDGIFIKTLDHPARNQPYTRRSKMPSPRGKQIKLQHLSLGMV